MRRARGGYTIVEVIIVLAVSGALFASAVTMFSGRQGRTQFTQAMEDLDSQIRTFANDISVSLYPEAGQYGCTVISNRPKLNTAPGGGVATNGDCIFLGKALQADTTASVGSIYAYTVLGTRANISGSAATTLSEARPSPAANPNTGELLRDTYKLGASSTISWSRVSTSASIPASPSTDMVGLYNNLQPTSGTGRQPVLTYGYVGFASGGDVKSAIENSTGLIEVQNWFLCIKSGSSNQYARLTVSATPAGITTKIDYLVSCS